MCIFFYCLCGCCFFCTTVYILSDLLILPFWNNVLQTSYFSMIVLLCACYLMGYACQAITGKYRGSVWGCKIVAPYAIRCFRLIGIVGGLISTAFVLLNFRAIIFSLVQDIIGFFTGFVEILFTGDAKSYFIWALFFLIKAAIILLVFALGLKMATIVSIKLYSFSPDLMKFERLPIFRELDKNIDKAKWIYIDGTEIRVQTFDKGELRFIYESYNLSPLQRKVIRGEVKKVASFEVGLLGLYLTKKYGKTFKYSVKRTLVKGVSRSSGMRVTVVTPSGVSYGYVGGTSGTPDRRVFDGYLFIRKHKVVKKVDKNSICQ